jgi:hypothetical protein
MKTIISVLLIIFVVSINSYGQKIAIGKYSSKVPSDTLYYAALEAIPGIQFTVKTTDNQQRIIQAEQWSLGVDKQIFASISISVKQDGSKSIIQATVTSCPGFLAGAKPIKLALQLGDYIKKIIPDLKISANDSRSEIID